MRTFTETQLPPEFIVEGLLPCDIGARIGAGGTAKSTLDLWEFLHIIMGWKLYGREVLRPGKVLLVSSEDNVRRIRFRLRMLCEQLVDLTVAAKEHIASSLFVEDLTGKGVRLVAVDSGGNLTQTGAGDALVDAYAGKGLSLVSFDPFVYFAPGERFVNDGEAAMAQAAHRICNGFGAAVRYVHHTVRRLGDHGRRVEDGVTDVTVRRERIRAAILEGGLGAVVAGRGASGKPETYAQVFVRLYGEPLEAGASGGDAA